MDGNTRLCTATAAAALKLSFGTDGQPGSYSDLDVTDAIMHVGHNIAFSKPCSGCEFWIGLRAPTGPSSS